MKTKSVVPSFLSVIILLQLANAQNLSVGYYSKSCPNLESIVEKTTARFVSSAKSLAPALLRMHFHDCFVRGCDGSVLINTRSKNDPAEKDSLPNQSLRGFKVIDAVKSDVEKACRNKVSCADILALVARDAVKLIGGPSWPVPLGRKDGRISRANESLANLPPPFFNVTQLIASFASKNLTAKDLVILSGGHTIGISHCSSFSSRLYNFNGQVNSSDPSMDPKYVAALKKKCPPPGNTTNIVDMDPGSGLDFDTNYYKILAQRRGLFQSDATLLQNSVTNAYIQQHVNAAAESSFFKDFADSMVKMGKIGVLTGPPGEIRKICSKIN
ncbi:peroxidase 27-like [Dorcoceras hygrometricum]|uniref:Peroxidase n=1 Tax=Dorcoceras hygrometricum TaxID=472368 RepID=A0A2Z7CVI8_9LAMI|nr:peroxidase 27-like [Dorcoceras hygrometricum]